MGLAGGINTYAYVEGNPLSFVDPLGLRSATPAHRWNRFQQFFAGSGLNSRQVSEVYRQLGLNDLGNVKNPTLHEALGNLPDRSEEVLNGIPKDCLGSSCVVEVEVCICNYQDDRDKYSCLVENHGPSLRPPKNQDPMCTCWTESRAVPGL